MPRIVAVQFMGSPLVKIGIALDVTRASGSIHPPVLVRWYSLFIQMLILHHSLVPM